MRAQEIAHALHSRPKLSGKEWRVPCIAHDGDGFNLALADAESGGLLAFCHSQGCSYKSILAAIEKQIPTFRQEHDYGAGRIQRRKVGRGDERFGNSPGSSKGAPLLIRGDQPGQRIAWVEGERTADAVLSLAGLGLGNYSAATAFKSDFNNMESAP